MDRTVPDVLDSVPSGELQVSYPSGVEVKLGNKLTPKEVEDEPKVQWVAEEGAFYTLCMTDPDAIVREFLHWLVVNIPGSKVSEGVVLSPYRGSGPPQGTGLHRYTFVLYKQNGRLPFDEKNQTYLTLEGRCYFSIRNFAAAQKLGEPIAGNIYLAEWDEYVTVLQKKPW